MKYKYATWKKGLAVILILVCAYVFIGSSFCIDQNLEQQENYQSKEYVNSEMFRSDAFSRLGWIEPACRNEDDIQQVIDRQYSADMTSLRFTVEKDGSYFGGNAVLQASDRTVQTYEFSTEDAAYRLLFTMDTESAVHDMFSFHYRIYNFVYGSIVPFVIGVIVSGLLALVSLLYLCYGAGRDITGEKLQLAFIDHIPYDILLVFAGFAVVGNALLVREYQYGYSLFQGILVAILPATAVLSALAVIVGFCARIKNGTLIKNTMLYSAFLLIVKVSLYILRLLADFVASIPLFFKEACFIVIFVMIVPALMFRMREGSVIYFGIISLVLLYYGYQLSRIARGSRNLAEGKYDELIRTTGMPPVLRKWAKDIGSLSEGMSKAVNEKIKADRLRTELITNVSHDIKTPLTSIINYVDLLKKEHTDLQQQEYLEILERQSSRLKKLTDDILEVSKATTGNIKLNLIVASGNQLVEQALGEYADKFSSKNLQTVVNLTEQNDQVLVDSRIAWRIINNVFSNVYKYSKEDTRVYIDTITEKNDLTITVRNVSNQQLNISPEELMERFVKGDVSRYTEGSGLGLNIARSLTELLSGEFTIAIDADLFKTVIRLPLTK